MTYLSLSIYYHELYVLSISHAKNFYPAGAHEKLQTGMIKYGRVMVGEIHHLMLLI
jgi:hypothetical protein